MSVKETIKNGFSGKFIRHLCMFIAVFIHVVSLVVNAVLGKIVIPIPDAIKVALFVLLVGLPIDVSMWLKIILGFFHVKVVTDDGKNTEVANVD